MTHEPAQDKTAMHGVDFDGFLAVFCERENLLAAYPHTCPDAEPLAGDPDAQLRAAGIPVVDVDLAEVAEEVETFARGSARLREAEAAEEDLEQGGVRHLRLDGEACPSGRPYPHAYDAQCSPALPKMAVPQAADPLEFQLPTVGRLRNALEAAKHERDQAQDEVTGLCQALAVLGADLNEAEAQRDRARSDVELVAADLRRIAADRDRYRRNFSATLLERDRLAAVAHRLVREAELWFDLRRFASVREAWQKVRDVLGTDEDEYMRMVLTGEAEERLADPPSLPSVKTYAPSILTVSDTGQTGQEA